MMKNLCLIIILLFSLVACEPLSSEPPMPIVESEIQTFMQSYADVLNKGDREEIASLYSKKGAYTVFNGKKTVNSIQQIERIYQKTWQGPASFQWCDLEILHISKNAAQVVGYFNWGTENKISQYSYTGLLIRENGDFKIRLEDETLSPENVKAENCS